MVIASAFVAVAVPVPLNATVAGLPAALLATDKDALVLPAATGVKVTETVQLAPAASEAPQVVDWA